ncbi:MAG: L-2-amino-thiazoline-4-carboxylic acid hydrolase [Candidatus Odinarchaeota archaeon]
MSVDERASSNKLEEQKKQFRRILFKQKCELADAMQERFGSGARDVILQWVKADTLKAWSLLAEKELAAGRKNDIANLIRLLWEPTKKDFSFTVEEKNGGTQIYCNHCPLATLAKELDFTRWGYDYYCSSDEWIVEGFNPEIGFKRTKTLMEGDDCCDHFYYIKSTLKMP